jgi:outer membrane protein assembly factor BamE
MYKSLICVLMMVMLTGCSFFMVRKPIIEQGNIITNENVSRLYTGMSPAQVVDVMGTPVLSNIFSTDRMEYVYTYKDRTNPLVVKRVICIFNDGKLRVIQRS